MKHSPITLTINDSEGMRLDRWLRKAYPALTQGMIEKFLRLGKIRLDGKKVAAGTRITLGQIVEIPHTLPSIPENPKKPPPKITPVTAEDLALLESMILWEDEDLLVLNKPSGLAAQGGTKTYRHLDGWLAAYGAKTGIQYRLVHRLDRDTSGVFLVAKTAEAAAYFSEAFREGTIKKVYWAIVVGQPKPGQGSIDAPLLKGGEGDQEKISVHKKGKPALTHYRTIKGLKVGERTQFAWLELSPQTGRTHQLRVHMAHIGNPILGDGKYGGKSAVQETRQLHLHARAITVVDRLTGAPLTFMAPPPSHMEMVFKKFKVMWEKA